jgi:hypothetical protein
MEEFSPVINLRLKEMRRNGGEFALLDLAEGERI